MAFSVSLLINYTVLTLCIELICNFEFINREVASGCMLLCKIFIDESPITVLYWTLRLLLKFLVLPQVFCLSKLH